MRNRNHLQNDATTYATSQNTFTKNLFHDLDKIFN